MLLKLHNIAEIGSGLVVNRKKAFQKSDVKKTYRQLNLRSINKNGYIIKSELEELNAKEIIDDYYLTQKGDIIIRLTDPFTAVYIDSNTEGIVISSNFCIVRCKNNYSSELLTYYINSDNAKKIIYNNLQGTIMKNINMSAIAELEVPNIPYEKQVIIGKLLAVQSKKIMVLEQTIEYEKKYQKRLLEKISE